MTSVPTYRVTTVLFDLGNTLHHLDHAFIAEVLTRHGHPTDAHAVAVAEYRGKAAVDATFRARRGGDDASRVVPYFETIMAALGIAPAAVEPVGAALRAENERRCLWRVLREDTPAVLAELRRRGYRLGIVSNADGRVEAEIATSGIAPHFNAVIDSHRVGVEKPDPRIFALALDAAGARPQDALFIGDIYEIDVAGARAAGLEALLLDPLGLYGAVDCERIASLDELLDLLPHRRGQSSSPRRPR
jgi:putative hydrolase of the HAD superfamily